MTLGRVTPGAVRQGWRPVESCSVSQSKGNAATGYAMLSNGKVRRRGVTCDGVEYSNGKAWCGWVR